jgi:hypothetical protein
MSGERRQATEQEMARLGQEAQDAEDSERAAAGARRHALTLVQPPPAVLASSGEKSHLQATFLCPRAVTPRGAS